MSFEVPSNTNQSQSKEVETIPDFQVGQMIDISDIGDFYNLVMRNTKDEGLKEKFLTNLENRQNQSKISKEDVKHHEGPGAISDLLMNFGCITDFKFNVDGVDNNARNIFVIKNLELQNRAGNQ